MTRNGGSCAEATDLLAVEPKVFDLLVHLIANRERVVSKDDLIAAIWDGRIVSESALTTAINAARAALGDSGEAQRLIKTLPRKGFRFVGRGAGGEARRRSWWIALRTCLLCQTSRRLPSFPFSNLSADAEQEYFADGIVEEMITELSRMRWLFVIARNSSFTYKGRSVDVKQVGHELGVRYVLQGSVRRAAQRLRITAQLVDATTGANLWADRFEGTLEDVFDLQDKVTTSVIAAISPQLEKAEIARVKRKPTENLDAYDIYLRGWRRSISGPEKAPRRPCAISTERSNLGRTWRPPTPWQRWRTQGARAAAGWWTESRRSRN